MSRSPLFHKQSKQKASNLEFSRSKSIKQTREGISYILSHNSFNISSLLFSEVRELSKMFRFFFVLALAIFLAASFGTSQSKSSNQVMHTVSCLFSTFRAQCWIDGLLIQQKHFNIKCGLLDLVKRRTKILSGGKI